MSRGRPGRQTATLSAEQTAIEERLRERLPRLLQAEREAKGWTQEALAERAGVHWTTVGKVERGRQVPSLAVIALLAKALEVPFVDLVGHVLDASKPSEDETVAFVQALPRAERRRLLPLLRALLDWKQAR